MKILYISSEYPVETGFGGIGTYTKYAAEGMARKGHTVHVICRSITQESRTINENGVTVHRIPSLDYQVPQGKLFYVFRRACYRFIPHTLIRHAWAKTVFLTAVEIDKTVHFDIVEYPECGAEGFFLKKHFKTRSTVRLHTPWEIVRKLDKLHESAIDTVLLTYMEKHSARNATAISCPSHALADKMRCDWRLKKITVFPNPITLNNFPKKTGTKWIYTGRVERRKGVHILIEAYSDISRHTTAPPLLIIGRPYGTMPDGSSYESHIQDLIDKIDSGNTVRWIKGAPPDEVKQYLRDSAVAFLPSLWENFPYSCLEALACGLALVASDCGGFPEILKHGENGFLVKPDDKNSLIAIMNDLLEDPEKVNCMSEAARGSIVKFDSDTVCKSIEEFYNSIVSSLK